MFDRYASWCKWLCLTLVALLAYQVVRLVAADHLPDQSSLGITFIQWSDEAGQRDGRDGDGESQKANSRSTSRVKLPAEIQAKVDVIQNSAVFGALPKPLPLALLGIGGNDAFIRAPNGQTGLLTAGEELGGIKLLRIEINQVVVEEDGQEKVLTLFPGLGGKTSR